MPNDSSPRPPAARSPLSDQSLSGQSPAAPPSGRFVVVRAAVAPMHGEPRVSSPQISQALAGHPLLVLEERAGGWLRVVGEDGYDGWVHAGYVAAVGDAELRDGLGAVPAVVRGWAAPEGRTAYPWRVAVDRAALAARTSLGCVVAGAAAGERPFPLGAWVGPGERVVAGAAVGADERAARFQDAAASVAGSAATLFAGTSYQWGGVTPWGADCSGFVQSVFALHGRLLPRDAWQQALVGTDAGTAVGDLCPADLLFFSDRDDRRITHVGVALGASRMAHVALGRGGFSIERLDDAADPYVAGLRVNFVGARRIGFEL